jgi:hypothetical protein
MLFYHSRNFPALHESILALPTGSLWALTSAYTTHCFLWSHDGQYIPASHWSVCTRQTVQHLYTHIPYSVATHIQHCYSSPNWQVSALCLSLLPGKMFTAAFKQSHCSSYTYVRSGCMYVRIRFARQSWGRQDEMRRCFLGGELKLKQHNTFQYEITNPKGLISPNRYGNWKFVTKGTKA